MDHTFRCGAYLFNKAKSVTYFSCDFYRTSNPKQIIKSLSGQCIGPTPGPDGNWLLDCTTSLDDTIRMNLSRVSEQGIVEATIEWIGTTYLEQGKLCQDGCINTPQEYSPQDCSTQDYSFFAIPLAGFGLVQAYVAWNENDSSLKKLAHYGLSGCWLAGAVMVYLNPTLAWSGQQL